jgi:nitrite reductase/ring-hydroxylating ferredoxin subunit
VTAGAGPGAEGPPPGFARAAALEDVPPGALKAARLDGLAVVLCNVEGAIFAVEDNCSHQHFPLSEGDLEDETLTCAWHGAAFDIRTGDALQLPAVEPVRTFEVRVEDGRVWVRTAGEAPSPAEALIQRDAV